MASVEEIKQEIRDWFNDPEEPLISAFTAFVGQLCYRRSEVTLPSGVAKLWNIEETRVVFDVNGQLFAAHKDRDEIVDGTTYIQDWQVDDLYEVEPVQVTVTDYQKKTD